MALQSRASNTLQIPSTQHHHKSPTKPLKLTLTLPSMDQTVQENLSPKMDRSPTTHTKDTKPHTGTTTLRLTQSDTTPLSEYPLCEELTTQISIYQDDIKYNDLNQLTTTCTTTTDCCMESHLSKDELNVTTEIDLELDNDESHEIDMKHIELDDGFSSYDFLNTLKKEQHHGILYLSSFSVSATVSIFISFKMCL